VSPVFKLFSSLYYSNINIFMFSYTRKCIYHLSQYVSNVMYGRRFLSMQNEKKNYLIKITLFGTIVLQRRPPLLLCPLLAEAATFPGRSCSAIAATAAILFHARFLILAGAPQVAQLPSQVVPLLHTR
jgi:hypothetical protein